MVDVDKLMKKEIAVLLALRKFSDKVDFVYNGLKHLRNSSDPSIISREMQTIKKTSRELLKDWKGWLGVERAERMAAKELNKYIKSVNKYIGTKDFLDIHKEKLSKALEKMQTYNEDLITNLSRGGKVEKELEQFLANLEKFKAIRADGKINNNSLNQLIAEISAIDKRVGWSEREVKALESILKGITKLIYNIGALN